MKLKSKSRKILAIVGVLVLIGIIGGFMDRHETVDGNESLVLEGAAGELNEGDSDMSSYVNSMVNRHNSFVSSLSELGTLLSSMKGDDVWYNDVVTEAMVASGIAKGFTELKAPRSKQEVHTNYIEHTTAIEAALREIAVMFNRYSLTDDDLERLSELSELVVSKATPLSEAMDLIMK